MSVNWRESMQQSFKYYEVDPLTWMNKEEIPNVRNSSIDWDADTDTLVSASIDIEDLQKECYIRVYLVTIQNGVKEEHPLGTFLVQTPSQSFNGKSRTITLDAYSPLTELKESYPPLGFTVMSGENIMENVCQLTKEHVRAPVVFAKSEKLVFADFTADPDDEWLSYLRDLMSNAKHSYDLDPLGRVLFKPRQDLEALQPVWDYTDDNSSILYPDITMDRDLYGIPNVVEVFYSSNNESFYAKVVNDDENSPISTVNRGREVVYRTTNPDISGIPTQAQIQEYAESLLRSLSSLEYKLKYQHGYNGVRIGDCVSLNYVRAGITNVKAKVTAQTISCKTGCPVTETAVFTTKLWG